jgi:hypothetical protein
MVMGNTNTQVTRWRLCGWSCDCCHDENAQDAPTLAPAASQAKFATAETERRRLAIARALEALEAGI